MQNIPLVYAKQTLVVCNVNMMFIREDKILFTNTNKCHYHWRKINISK